MGNKIYLVRHGENVANITKEFSYKKVDYSLTSKGILQAKQTAKVFKNLNIDYIVSSPLKRAVETAEIISKEINVCYEINENFREINVGSLEGKKPNKDAWDEFYLVVGKWLTDNPAMKFSGGENLNSLVERFNKGLLEVIENHSGNNILIVGHGGIFTHGIIELGKIKNKKQFYDQDNGNCSITELEITKVNNELDIKVLRWANVDHLSVEAALIVPSLLK